MAWSPRAAVAAALNGQYATTAFGADVWRARTDGTNIYVQHSADEGRTLAAAEVTVSAGTAIYLDQPFIYDPITGRLHLLYGRQVDDAANPPLLLHRWSDDKGVTWSTEQSISLTGVSSGNNRFLRLALAARNGVVNLFVTSEDNSAFTTQGLWHYRSTDGGATWAAPVQMFAATTMNPLRPECKHNANGLYLTWYDTRGNATTGAGSGGGDVYFARSDDDGVTWPTTPDRRTTSTDCGRPTLATDNGDVTLAYMEPFGNGIISDVHVQHSGDNGQSWDAAITADTHPGASYGDSHPFAVQWGKTVAVIFTDVQTPSLNALVSTDGGATFGPRQLIFNYAAASGSSDAPWAVITTNYLTAFGWDANDGQFYRSTNPLFAMQPTANTPLIDQFNRADENPVSDGGKWSAGVTTATGVRLSGNQVTRQNGVGSFDRSGSWRNDIVIPDNGSAEVYFTIPTVGGAIDAYLIDPSTKNGYSFVSQDAAGFSTDASKLARFDAGTETDVVLDNSTGAQAGDLVCLQVAATEVVAWRKRSGGQFTEFARIVDTAHRTALRLGLEIAGQSLVADVDDFGGGVLTAPAVSVAPSVSGVAQAGSTLSAAAGTYTMAPTRYGYQWQAETGAGTNVYADITGACLPWFTPDVSYTGRRIRVVITATNAIGSTSTASAATAAVTNPSPGVPVTLSSQQIKRAALTPAYSAASAGGDRFTPGRTAFLHVKNGGAGAVTVTVKATGKVDGDIAMADVVTNVAAGAEAMVGPFPSQMFEATDGSGLADITYSGVTSVTVAALNLSQP